MTRTRLARFFSTLSLVAAAALSTSTPRAQGTPGPYTLIDLGTLGTGSAQANGMNEAGQITGYATNALGQARPFLWDSGHMTDLGTLGGTTGVGLGINGLGHVAGYSKLVPAGASVATLWRDGAVINITPDLAAGEGSSANAINDRGQLVGSNAYGKGFLWENGVRTTLPDLGGGYGSFPQDINNAGQIVGSSYAVDAAVPVAHAFLLDNGTITDLGVLPGDQESGASAINELGVIVGSSGWTDPDTYQQFYRPFIYENGQMRAIPVPGTESYGGDVNDHGDVVGSMRAGGAVTPWHAFIYQDGVLTNLNAVKPTGTGLHLANATGINNAGQISGIAMDAQGRYHAFLLAPGGVAPPPVLPALSVTDVNVLEGRNGTTAATFRVTLSQASTGRVLVNFITGNGTAIAGEDFTFASGTLAFNPGETTKTITVSVKGDRIREADETFKVTLSAADGATIFDAVGAGTIHNDDK